jgi:hypothetical protein
MREMRDAVSIRHRVSLAMASEAASRFRKAELHVTAANGSCEVNLMSWKQKEQSIYEIPDGCQKEKVSHSLCLALLSQSHLLVVPVNGLYSTFNLNSNFQVTSRIPTPTSFNQQSPTSTAQTSSTIAKHCWTSHTYGTRQWRASSFSVPPWRCF